MAWIYGDKVIFDSGKEWAPDSDGVIGLSPELRLYEGYDSRAEISLTPAQRVELADLMIARWQAFKDKPDTDR